MYVKFRVICKFVGKWQFLNVYICVYLYGWFATRIDGFPFIIYSAMFRLIKLVLQSNFYVS